MSSFRYESEMTGCVEGWLTDQGLWVHPEYATPSGPCDLVGFAFREEGVRRRLDLKQIASVRDLKRLTLLHSVPSEPEASAISRGDLARDFADFMSPSMVQEATTWLVRQGFLKETEEGFRRINHYAPLEERVVAVEIKRRRVREVLHQALQRRSFATETIIALPEARARALLESPTGEDIRQKGVGVLAVDPGACELVLDPAPVSCEIVHPILRALCVERFWNRVIRA